MVKRGLITIACSFAAMIASFPLGVGPCGPTSLPGVILFYGGGIAFLVGLGLVSFGLIGRLIRRARQVD